MPPKPLSASDNPSSSRVYSSSPSLHQVSFAPRRRIVRTYGKRSSLPTATQLRQQTLTQIDYLVAEGPIPLDDDEDEDDDDDGAGRRRNPASAPPQKRQRKSEGYGAGMPIPSSHKTQTLTQLFSSMDPDAEQDRLMINDSEDDEETEIEESPIKAKSQQAPIIGKARSRSASVVPQTPARRRFTSEIPSSLASANTPMFERYGPVADCPSPLGNKSSNARTPASTQQSVEKPKRSRTSIIQDSCETDEVGSSIKRSTPKRGFSEAIAEEDGEDEVIEMTPARPRPRTPRTSVGPERRPRTEEIPDSEAESEDCPGSPDSRVEEAIQDDSTGHGQGNHNTPSTDDESSHSPVQREGTQQERTQQKGSKYPAGEESCYAAGAETQFALNFAATSEQAGRSTSRSRGVPLSVSSSPALRVAPPLPESRTVHQPSSPNTQLQSQVYTQMGSQRVDLNIIRSMPTPTDRTDVFISMHAAAMSHIMNGTKDHEFRRYKMPDTVVRMWVYVTKPESRLRYMICLGDTGAKRPGEIADEGNAGNQAFNARVEDGSADSWFAYELADVYELNNPISLRRMREFGYLDGAPQKYVFVPPVIVARLMGNLRGRVFSREEVDGQQAALDGHELIAETQDDGSPGAARHTVSQEVAAQIRDDIAYSTQTGPSSDILVPCSQESPTSRRTNHNGPGSSETQFRRPVIPRRVRPAAVPGHVPASQATTVSQSSSPPPSQAKVTQGGSSGLPPPPLLSSQAFGIGELESGSLSLAGWSQIPTRSQLLPDSMLREEGREPPMIRDSEDEEDDEEEEV